MVHRAITVVLLIVICLILLVVAIGGEVRQLGWMGIWPLFILVGVSAVVGVVISWRRYFPGARRRQRSP